MQHPTNNCNFNIIRNEVNEHVELAAKRPCASHCQPSSAAQDTSKTTDKGTCQEGCYDVSTFSHHAIKCANNLFHSKYHQRDFCKEGDCCSVSKNEAEQLSKQSYKFEHSWLQKRSLSFFVPTEMWWPVYVERQGLYCLLCKKA